METVTENLISSDPRAAVQCQPLGKPRRTGKGVHHHAMRSSEEGQLAWQRGRDVFQDCGTWCVARQRKDESYPSDRCGVWQCEFRLYCAPQARDLPADS